MVKKSKASDDDYAKLGRSLTYVLLSEHIHVMVNWRRFILVNFARGLLVGFGSVIGATLVAGLVIWLVSIFGGLPLVGQWFDALQQALEPS